MKDRILHLAIDIGASSGRHILGFLENGEIKTKEIYRFPNGVKNVDGHLTWDISSLLSEVKKGIDVALSLYPVKSLSIDTWGVDYVLLSDDKIIEPVFAYRDHRTDEVIDTVHNIMPFKELYKRTGIQFQSFNTIYQLYWDSINDRLSDATEFLMIPEYLSYALTGNKVKEYTNATTTGLINRESGEYDKEIISALSLPSSLFTQLSSPKTKVGEYKGIDVILCATHDTASAVEGMGIEGNEPYISSGTWSLLGLKVPSPITDEKSEKGNWSNEGGVGYTRYQKNIMGMWLINRLKEELEPSISFVEFNAMTESSTFEGFVDAEDPAFLSPVSMKEAFDEKLGVKGLSSKDYFRCAVTSLSKSYGKAIRELEENTGRKFTKLFIVGGGANNRLLNTLTEKETGLLVVARAMEATAIGNLKIQAEAYDEL
ncbi:MAG: FGGY family carbohydrate kinase [Spirochaetales bacterium]|nr:FGGY family carbohydrate kinase [Spirochaetales bacterium]